MQTEINKTSETLSLKLAFTDKIKGNSNTSSTSNTRKIIHTKKNRNEKGRRALYFVVNPHSKGLNFSMSSMVFLDNRLPIRIINTVTLANKTTNTHNKLIFT